MEPGTGPDPKTPPKAPRRHYAPAVLVAVLGVALSAAACLTVRHLERRRAQSEFGEAAATPVIAVQERLELYIEDLRSIRRFYAASRLVERGEFTAYVGGILARRQAIEALAWAPQVRDSQRSALEAAARADRLPGLRITERAPDGHPVPAARRDLYYPLWYVEPNAGEAPFLGLDLGSDPSIPLVLQAACDSGTPQAALVDGITGRTDSRPLLAAFLPVYRGGIPDRTPSDVPRTILMGYLVGLYRIGDLLAEALSETGAGGVQLQVYAGMAPAAARPIASYPLGVIPASNPAAALAAARRRGGLAYVSHVEIAGGDRWTVVCTPGAKYRASVRLRSAWYVLALGLLLTSLLTAYVLTVTGRAAWAHGLVTQRTADLSLANAELQQEIARRERVEEALRDSEQRYRMLIERMNEGLSILDREGRFTYANPTMCRMLGYTQEELLGHTPGDFMEEANRAILLDQLDRRRRGEEAPYEVAFTHRRGHPVHTIISPSPVRDASGGYQGTFAVVTDISSRKHAEDQLQRMSAELRRSNLELEQFAYVASHDLQEPLRKIVAFGDRLEAKCRSALDDQGRDYLGRMQSAAKRMQALINDLLMYSRVTTKGRPFVPVDLGQVAQGVLSDLEVRVQDTGARVEVGPLPTLDADPAQMRQLFQNLIGNALKFRRPEVVPVVSVTAEVVAQTAPDRPESCRIVVEDNGIGFDEKHVERIFGVFQRLHARDEYEGTGIGLAVCRRVAERHGGAITAESTPGQGSRFIVMLPVKQTGEEAPHEEVG